MKQVLELFRLNPKRLFLVDALGACLTTALLLALLIPLREVFGMPLLVLRILTVPAFLLAVYSFCCFLFVRSHFKIVLKMMAAANGLYCCLVIYFLITCFQLLSILSICYFLLELLMIGALILIELKTASHQKE